MTDGLFTSYFDQLDRQKAGATGLGLSQSPRTPDQAAMERDTARELNVMPVVVGSDPEFFSGVLAQKRATTALSQAPKTTQWLANPDNGDLAKDDLANLTWWEAAGNSLVRSVASAPQTYNQWQTFSARRRAVDSQRSFADIVQDERNPILGPDGEELGRELPGPGDAISAGSRYLMSRLSGVAGLDDEAGAAAFQQRAAEWAQYIGRVPLNKAGTKWRDQIGNFKPSGSWGTDLANVGRMIGEDPVGFVSFLAQVSGESLPPMVAAGAAGAVTRNPQVAAAVMATLSGAREYGTAPMEVLNDSGLDLTTPEGAAAALADEGLMRKAQERGELRGLIIGALDGLSGGIAGKMLARSEIGNLLLQGFAQAGFGAGGEALAQVATGEEINIAEVLIEGLAEFVTAPVEVVAIGGRRFPSMVGRFSKAGATARALDEVDAQAGASVLKQRAPDKWLEALEAQGNGDVTLLVPSDAVNEYFQSLDVTVDEETLRAWGIEPASWEQALASGADISIPVSSYAANISGTDAASFIRENARFNEDEMSVAEAKAFNDAWREEMEAEMREVEAQQAEDNKWRADEVVIQDEIRTQLRAAGQSPDVAEYSAAPITAFMTTMADRVGVAPLELFRRYSTQIIGAVDQGIVRRRGRIDAAVNAIRERGAVTVSPADRLKAAEREALDKFPELRQARPFTQRMIRAGGVAPGSPLATELAARGVTPKTSPGLFRKGGLTAADNLVAGEFFDGPALIGADEATGYLQPDAVIEAIEAEMRGQKVPGSQDAALALSELEAMRGATAEALTTPAAYAEGLDPASEEGRVAAMLDAMGLDVATMSNDEIAAALGEAEMVAAVPQAAGLELDQPGSDAFKAWFGDSKVVDADGNPLVVYHGTRADVEAFGADKVGSRFPYSQGYYFSTAPRASSYADSAANAAVGWNANSPFAKPVADGANVMPVYLSIQNPMVLDTRLVGENAVDGTDAIQRAKEAGHDGVIVRVNGEPDLWVAFEPTQIKSVNNSGAFDPADPRILYQDYRDSHTAPDAESGVPLHDMMADGNKVYPDDFYGPQGMNYYGTGDDDADRAAYQIIKKLRGEPDAMVTIYRAVPSQYADQAINPGDWVGITKAYAQDHGDSRFDGDFAILESKVPARELFTNGDSFLEWGWSPDGQTLNQDKRGSITFPQGGVSQGTSLIRLFDNADLSTVLHESAHLFLEIYQDLASQPNAPEQLKADFAVIRKWQGAKDGEAITVAQHEKWARGVEAYLMEGQAPSLELMDAFSRFKSWLTRIYQSVKALRAPLNDDIRAVMDRMLASDAAIAEARSINQSGAMFAERGPAGMSEADWQTYQRMAKQGQQQAEAGMLKRMMEKVRREKTKWWKEERKAVQAEVEREFSTQRSFRLVGVLADQKWIGGTTSAQIPDIQIDRAALEEVAGAGIIKELHKNKIGGKRAIYAKGGTAPQAVADLFGYDTVTEMIGELQNMQPFKQAVQAETDRRMTERHGDVLTDGTIEAEAMAAIHNERQQEKDVVELRALARLAGKPERELRSRTFKLRARAMIGAMSVREAAKPNTFLRAERKAAAEAQAAFAGVARGGLNSGTALEQAYAAKERQVLNSHLFREAREVQDNVAKAREKFRSYGKRTVREAIGSPHIERIDDLLATYDFKARSQKWLNNRQAMREYVDMMTAEGREAELAIDPEIMAEDGSKHYTKMRVSEFNGLVDTVRNIESMGRRKGKVIDARRERLEAEVLEGITEAFEKNLTKKTPGRVAQPGERRDKNLRDALNWTLNADTLLREIDGREDLGPAWRGLKEDVDAGLSRLTVRKAEVAKSFDDLFGVYSMAEKRDMAIKRSVPELGGEFSKMDLLALALNTGNADNWQRLTNPKVNGHFSESQINDALKRLDQKDWDFAQSMLDYINSFWGDISTKETRMTGVAPRKVEGQVMTTAAPASFKGGYFPISYDRRISARADDLSQAAVADELRGGRISKAQTSKGHTKERQASSTQPINLDLSVAFDHVNRVIYDLEMGEPVANSWRLLSKLKDTFYSYGRHSDFEALESWIKDVAVGDRSAVHGWGRVLRSMRSGFSFSRLALSLTTVALQPTGIAQSLVVVGKAPMARGMVKYLSNPSRWGQDIIAASPFMRERQNTFQRDIHNILGDLDTASMTGGRWTKAQRDYIVPASFYLMQKVQFYTVDAPTWLAAYDDGRAKGRSEEEARTYADLMVKRAQGSGLLSDRGMLERGKFTPSQEMNEMPKLLTTLGSYMFAKFNVAYERSQGVKWSNPIETISWAGDMALLFAFEAALAAIIRSELPDEDENWAAWLLKETGMSVLGTLPVVRDVASALDGFGSGGAQSGALDLGLVRPLLELNRLWGGGDFDRRSVTTALDMAGIWFNLPSAQVNRTIKGFFDEDLNYAPGTPWAMLGVGQGKGRSLFEVLLGD